MHSLATANRPNGRKCSQAAQIPRHHSPLTLVRFENTPREGRPKMKLLWYCLFLLSLLLGAYGDSVVCQQGYTAKEGKCVTQRPVHGACPKDSKYDLNWNLCVYE
ncbi:uncharacterized protein LOC125948642 isoform X2 [Anopheles darlingi]|uniref:uncharacterized protein LOC125948642 isoform X2 n=1 Tax=Anopheles darlingi TaxID=43151 RepID=UPI0021006326|nr:uncharacterized protein LOC125948642 isoform X2 [Anopheles darlingi]